MKKDNVDMALFFVSLFFFLVMSIFVSVFLVSNDVILLRKANIPAFIFLKTNVNKVDAILFKKRLLTNRMIYKVDLISKQNAMDNMMKTFSINKSLFRNNPFPYSLKVFFKPNFVSIENLNNLKSQLKRYNVVDDLKYPINIFNNINQLQHTFNLSVKLIIILLYVLEFIVIGSIIRILYSRRKFDYDTLKLLGAYRFTLLKLFTKRTTILSIFSAIAGSVIVILVSYFYIHYANVFNIPNRTIFNALKVSIILNVIMMLIFSVISSFFTFIIKDEKV